MSQVKIFPEPALLRRIAEGDEHSFSALFTHYYQVLRPFVLKFSKSEIDTEEILQETFIRIWLSRDKLPLVENLDGWVYRITSRECLTFLRRSKIRRTDLTLDACYDIQVSKQASPFEKLGNKEMQKTIDELVEKMPSQRKKIFRLSREEGLKPAEIADTLSLSVSTVKNTLCASLREIRQQLTRLGYENLSILIWYFTFI